MMRILTLVLTFALAALAPAAADEKPVMKVGFAKCAHCMPLALLPDYAEGVTIQAIPFATAADALTALVSKSIDVAQSTYPGFASALDRGFDVVAISGHVNGGSQLLVGNDVALQPDDWEALKALVAKNKAEGKPFRVAASRGSAQDLHLRGALAKHGIDVNKDVTFVNIPNPSDHMQALRRGEAEMICTVEPFATDIRQHKAARFFAFPYDQAAGTLTGIILTRSDEIAQRPKDVEAVVKAWLKVDDAITADKSKWADVIVKQTGTSRAVAEESIGNLMPDRKMYRATAAAIASMMYDLRYIQHDMSKEVQNHLDYRFLEEATGKNKSALGD